MPPPAWLHLNPEVQAALHAGLPVVALESTVIAHGLPRPLNLETALALEATVRAAGATPATIAVCAGQPTVGLTGEQLRQLARSDGILKASPRDLAIARQRRALAATTVAGTMFLAHQVGIAVLATGGIGGAHRDTGQPWDISADLLELARTPVAVVCAGAKSILDLPRTLEILETHAVPVLGFQCTDFPAFYLHSSGMPVTARVEDVAAAAEICAFHWEMGGGGILLAQPLPAAEALDPAEFDGWLRRVEQQALAEGVRGQALTPYLLAGLAKVSQGKTLEANRKLLLANARLGAQLAVELAARRSRQPESDSL